MYVDALTFLKLANSGYFWNVKVNDADDLCCQSTTPPCGTFVLREQSDGRSKFYLAKFIFF